MDSIISEYLNESKFVSITDISLDSSDRIMNLKEMMNFFDFVLYHRCNYEQNVMENYLQIETPLDTITPDLIQRCQNIIKKISLKNTITKHAEYSHFYEKYKRYIQSIFDILYEKDDGIFFISNVNDTENMMCIFNYKSMWRTILQNQESMDKFTDLDMIMMLSGYIYIFQTKNIMGRHFDGIQDSIIIVYYEKDYQTNG
jgi:hypothetical protein